MEEKYVLEFAFTVIVTGIEKKLSSDKIVSNVDGFINYLKDQKLATARTIATLEVLKDVIPRIKKLNKDQATDILSGLVEDEEEDEEEAKAEIILGEPDLEEDDERVNDGCGGTVYGRHSC